MNYKTLPHQRIRIVRETGGQFVSNKNELVAE
jgi:hypothetical protein